MKTPFTLLFLLIYLITSCDPISYYSRIVQNNSTYEIYVIKKNYPVCDTFTLAPGQEHIIYEEEQMVSTKAFKNCPFRNMQSDTFSLQVKDNPSLSINADLSGNGNWYFSSEKKSLNRGGHCNCRLTITDDLIQ